MSVLLEDEVEETGELVLPRLLLVPPRLKTKLSSGETVTGNRYDVVLACQPDALDHYELYDNIEELVENRKRLRIYCPHRDLATNKELSEVVDFTVREAIPRTKIVLVHLTTITPEIQKMFDATHLNNKPFILFYAEETRPFNKTTARNIRNHFCYRGEYAYFNEEHVVGLLDEAIDDALRVG
ncbi:MAG: hypothetical protein AABX29_05635 [Nanoarchaeota archaeon]